MVRFVCRAILLLSLTALLPLAGCGEAPPPSYAPPSYDHLTTIKLNVGRIDIDDSWAPRGASRRVEHLAPITPRLALRRMAEDRLIAGGTEGRAVFVIEDASIIRAPKHYEGTLAVRLDMADEGGQRLGQAVARVTQIRPLGGESERAIRDELSAFVRELMEEMNVELEFQARRALKDALQTTSPNAPAPAPVESQTLDGGQPTPPPSDVPPIDPPAPPPAAPVITAPPSLTQGAGPRPTPLLLGPPPPSTLSPPAQPLGTLPAILPRVP